MPTALPAIADLTGAGVTEAGFKTQLTDLLASMREVGDPLGQFGLIQNLGLALSVSGNALTCRVKQRDGSTDATSTNAIAVGFRGATAANGDFNIRNITAALSLTISSGSTLGHGNNLSDYIHWYLIDNSGTVELAASTKFFGNYGIVSTTAEGGAGAADSATTMYSSSARSNVPFVFIGRTTDTQTTAGTWASAPTLVELAPLPRLSQLRLVPETRDLTAASGNQNISGAGFKPDGAIILAGVNASASYSMGMDDGVTPRCWYNSSGTFSVGNNTSSINIAVAGGSQSASFSSFHADGGTLAWTKTSSPTGNAALNILFFKLS